jgi:hypothetical protein
MQYVQLSNPNTAAGAAVVQVYFTDQKHSSLLLLKLKIAVELLYEVPESSYSLSLLECNILYVLRISPISISKSISLSLSHGATVLRDFYLGWKLLFRQVVHDPELCFTFSAVLPRGCQLISTGFSAT